MIETNNSIEIKGHSFEALENILTEEAIEFVVALHAKFNSTRKQLLKAREERKLLIDKGEMPDFLPETAQIRQSMWTVSSLPEDLLERRVEITGPVDRKMIINALNSGANVFMADLEDSNSPTWENIIHGQVNLRDAVNKTISFENHENGKVYKLNPETAVLMVRPRGWHMEEKHFLIAGEPCSASIFDFALYFFHNVKTLLKNSTGPYFYLPKMESHLEARLWNSVFVEAQNLLGIPVGTIKATVLIETILASFEMDEILFELKEHSSGLNCGRWDYIFSYIKKFSNNPDFILPDRSQITMATHFMSSYSLLLIKTCHKRNVHAMGGMAAQIPIKNDPKANEQALLKVKADKEREATNGHDGTWVAHPGLIPIAKAAFDSKMLDKNQLNVKREDVQITASDLLRIPKGTITKEGVITNIDVAIQYIEAWLRGFGCVPIYNLMEDAATAEISRTQLWQWLHSVNAKLEDGTSVSVDVYNELKTIAIKRIETLVGIEAYSSGKYSEASQLLDQLVLSDTLEDFLTTKAYNLI